MTDLAVVAQIGTVDRRRPVRCVATQEGGTARRIHGALAEMLAP